MKLAQKRNMLWSAVIIIVIILVIIIARTFADDIMWPKELLAANLEWNKYEVLDNGSSGSHIRVEATYDETVDYIDALKENGYHFVATDLSSNEKEAISAVYGIVWTGQYRDRYVRLWCNGRAYDGFLIIYYGTAHYVGLD